MLRLLRGRVGDDLTLVSVGGITTVADARARLDAGATLLQGYTAFVYEGPLWPRRILVVSTSSTGARPGRHDARPREVRSTSPARCWRASASVPTST